MIASDQLWSHEKSEIKKTIFSMNFRKVLIIEKLFYHDSWAFSMSWEKVRWYIFEFQQWISQTYSLMFTVNNEYFIRKHANSLETILIKKLLSGQARKPLGEDKWEIATLGKRFTFPHYKFSVNIASPWKKVPNWKKWSKIH